VVLLAVFVVFVEQFCYNIAVLVVDNYTFLEVEAAYKFDLKEEVAAVWWSL